MCLHLKMSCLLQTFCFRINLNVLTLNVESSKVYTVQGVPISVTGIAQVCVWKEQLFWHLLLAMYIISHFKRKTSLNL